MDRRSFLARSGVTLSAAISAPWLGRLQAFAAAAPAPTPLSGAGIAADGWRTLGLVQEFLFPSEPSAPGAMDINALSYLHFVMNWQGTDPAEPRILRAGLDKLGQIASATDGGSFERLDPPGRERALRALEAGPGGTEWILLLLDFIFEALLADPVYGGNPGQIGWRWLQIEPGYRRPDPDQRYFLL